MQKNQEERETLAEVHLDYYSDTYVLNQQRGRIPNF